MTFLRKVFNFYIKGSIHVGFAVYCLLRVTALCNNLTLDDNLPLCVFFGTVLCYNFLKYFSVITSKNFNSNKYNWIIAISFFAAFGFSICFINLDTALQHTILIAGFFAAVYPFLRKYGWLKLFLVGLVVSYVTVYIPFRTLNYNFEKMYFEFSQRVCILISLLIPFEILDSKTDDKSLNTLPQLFGIVQTKVFGIMMVITFLILEFLKFNFCATNVFIGLISVVCIRQTTLKRNSYYTSFLVESVPILWWLILLFVKK